MKTPSIVWVFSWTLEVLRPFSTADCLDASLLEGYNGNNPVLAMYAYATCVTLLSVSMLLAAIMSYFVADYVFDPTRVARLPAREREEEFMRKLATVMWMGCGALYLLLVGIWQYQLHDYEWWVQLPATTVMLAIFYAGFWALSPDKDHVFEIEIRT